MSAAEKLKVLDERLSSPKRGVRIVAADEYADALPQIRALVQAAADAEDILRAHGRGLELFEARHRLRDALAALDEALP